MTAATSRSAELFEQALKLAEKRYGSNDPALAVELNNLAEVHRLMGQLDKAEALYIRAIDHAGNIESTYTKIPLNL